jgi:hypothetical protein
MDDQAIGSAACSLESPNLKLLVKQLTIELNSAGVVVDGDDLVTIDVQQALQSHQHARYVDIRLAKRFGQGTLRDATVMLVQCLQECLHVLLARGSAADHTPLSCED